VTTITLLSQIFAKYLRSLTAKQRVRFIRTTFVADDSATLYMAKINQSHVKPSLNRFCRASVRTVLFDVTQAFARFDSRLGDADYDLFAWKRIGIVAIKNGTDPIAVRKFSPGNRSGTPLLSLFRLHKRREDIFKDISRPLKLWIQILREANVNLQTYFSEESRVWRSIDACCLLRKSPGMPQSTMHFVAVDLDPNTQRCIVRVCEKVFLPIMRLHHLPGSFTCRTEVPDKICWSPNSEELKEGHWVSSGPEVLPRGRVMDLQELCQDHAGTYPELVDSTQDDNGSVMRMIDKLQHSPRPRKRSPSQPAPLYRRRNEYKTVHVSRVHRWLPPMHFCIDESALILSNHRGGYDRFWDWDIHDAFIDPRRCAIGGDTKYHGGTDYPSFMNLSDLCQNDDGFLVFGQADLVALHDGTRDCPEGCGKINFSTVAKPHSLPAWHPGSFGSEL
jgi:hypothetical protein